MSIFLSDSGSNRFSFQNSAYDKLILNARTAQDLHERKVEYMQAQKILLEQEAIVVPLYYEMNRALVRDGFTGVNLNPLNYLLLRDVSVNRK
jgi:oligopeptide transport system substrate-binding protein